MKYMRLWIALYTLSFLLTSCASYFTRKDCEKTNWFQHGQNVAMRGQNLENDDFLSQCRKVESKISEQDLDLGFKKGRARYCEPDMVFLTGKQGEPLAIDMCDGSNKKLLRAQHLAGVLEFCLPSNGESAGATGRPYQNVCPKSMEADFLAEFKIGRKKYLSAEISSREMGVADVEREITDLNRERQFKSYQLIALGRSSRKVVSRVRRAGPGGVTYEDQVTESNDTSVEAERSDLTSSIDQLDWQIKTKRSQQATIREEIRKLRAEMLTL